MANAAAKIAMDLIPRQGVAAIPNNDPLPGWHKEVIPRKHDPSEYDCHFYSPCGRQFRSRAAIDRWDPSLQLDDFNFHKDTKRCTPIPSRTIFTSEMKAQWHALSPTEKEAVKRDADPDADAKDPPHPTTVIDAAKDAVQRSGGTKNQATCAGLIAAVQCHARTYNCRP